MEKEPLAISWRKLQRSTASYWDTSVINHFLSPPDKDLLGISYGNYRHLVFRTALELRKNLKPVGDFQNVSICVAICIPEGPFLPLAVSCTHLLNESQEGYASACIVPIDPSDGRERILQMLDQTRPAIILTASQCDADIFQGAIASMKRPPEDQVVDCILLRKQCCVILDIKELVAEANQEATCGTFSDLSVAPATRNRVSHVVFTSGTTGKPKGCVSSINSLLNYLDAKNKAHGIQSRSRVLLASSLSFDPCFSDVLATFKARATLVITDRTELYTQFAPLVNETASTHILVTPAVFKVATHSLTPEDVPSLKLVALGGEPIPGTISKVWGEVRTGCKLYATYGVTEACVYQTMGLVSSGGDCWGVAGQFVGRPLENNCIVLQDSDGNVFNAEEAGGKEGEIIIYGSQIDDLSRYHGDADLTKRRYLNLAGTLAYRTGDIGIFDKALGGIRVLGRIDGDSMVKINGIRIELGEVEAAVIDKRIENEPIVLDAIARPRIDPFAKFKDEPSSASQIDLYLVLSPGTIRELGVSASSLPSGVFCPEGPFLTLLRRRCKSWSRVQPSSFVLIYKIPLSSTGKRDRRLLPNLSDVKSSPLNDNPTPLVSYGRCGSYLAKAIIDCLNLQPGQLRLLTKSMTFAALGGDSLAAVRIVRFLFAAHNNIDESRALGGKYGKFDGPFAPSKLLNSLNLGDYVDSLDSQGVCSSAVLQSDGSSAPAGKGRNLVGHLLTASNPTSDEAALYDSLFEACSHGMHIITGALLDAGADPNFKATGTRLGKTSGRTERRQTFFSTPLHVAAALGDDILVDLLVSKRARCNIPDASGCFPLHLAVNGMGSPQSGEDDTRRMRIVKILLANGSVLTMKDLNKQTILHGAARSGSVRLLEYILQLWRSTVLSDPAKAKSLEWLDHWSRTPVHWAVLNGRVEALQLLLENGCSPTPYKARVVKASSIASESPLEICERVHGASDVGKRIRKILEVSIQKKACK